MITGVWPGGYEMWAFWFSSLSFVLAMSLIGTHAHWHDRAVRPNEVTISTPASGILQGVRLA